MDYLFSEFLPSSKAEWLAKIEADLKGKDISTLNWSSGDIELSPFHHVDDHQPYQPLSKNESGNTWKIVEVIPVDNISDANAQALEALNGGANALEFILPDDFSTDQLSDLISDIQHEWIQTRFDITHIKSDTILQAFTKVVSAKGQDISKVEVLFCTDDVFNESSESKNFHSSYNSKQDDPAQELLELLRKLNARMATGGSIAKVELRVSADDDFYMNIAKLRSVRILADLLCKAYEMDNSSGLKFNGQINSESYIDDQYQNMIKSSAQALSLAVGGADLITIAPANINECPSRFTRRIARNVHHILNMESYLDKVQDPLAGSYFIEELTDAMASKVWSLFQSNPDLT